MFALCVLVFVANIFSVISSQQPTILTREVELHTFPKDFSFGASTAAYQIEGAWDVDGKGPSIWDKLTHEHPELIADHSTGDDAADSYHLYKQDVAALKQVGVRNKFIFSSTFFLITKICFQFQHYRFSISWSRIFPFGPKVNEKAFEYYDKLIDELIVNGIEPVNFDFLCPAIFQTAFFQPKVVTLYHYDLPQWIQDEGGFLNPRIIIYFELYARTVFSKLGDRVKMWITFNEPFTECTEGYGMGTGAPLIKSSGYGEYICGHHVLLAHATAYHLYKKQFFENQRGMLGITLDGRFYYPKDESVSDDVIQRALNFDIGWFANPIFSKTGGYPKVMIDEIAERSKREGRAWSRLPEMNEEVREFIKGSADFLGYNYYSSRMVQLNTSEFDPNAEPSWTSDSRMIYSVKPSWKRAKSTWLFSVPEGLHDALVWFKDNYNNPTVIITENGWSDDGQLQDDGRIEYLKLHLASISKAIDDGCKVIGYTTWSIIDNFEWRKGFSEHFGLYAVNRTSPNKERTAKKSAGFLHKVIKNRFI